MFLIVGFLDWQQHNPITKEKMLVGNEMPDKRNEVPKNRHEMHYLYDELADI